MFVSRFSLKFCFIFVCFYATCDKERKLVSHLGDVEGLSFPAMKESMIFYIVLLSKQYRRVTSYLVTIRFLDRNKHNNRRTHDL